jgi:hypothetical protein
MMKESAVFHKIDPASIALGLEGEPPCRMQGRVRRESKMGVWKSSAHHIYQRSTRMDEGALAVMSHKDVSVLHSRDVIN